MAEQARQMEEAQTFFAPSRPDDVDALRRTFRAHGHVRMPNFLADEAAHSLRDHLLARDDWRRAFNAGDMADRVGRPADVPPRRGARRGARSGLQLPRSVRRPADAQRIASDACRLFPPLVGDRMDAEPAPARLIPKFRSAATARPGPISRAAPVHQKCPSEVHRGGYEEVPAEDVICARIGVGLGLV